MRFRFRRWGGYGRCGERERGRIKAGQKDNMAFDIRFLLERTPSNAEDCAAAMPEIRHCGMGIGWDP